MIRFFSSRFQDSKIHSITKYREADFIFPASVYYVNLKLTIHHKIPLCGLWKVYSRPSTLTYLLHPPGIKASSVFISFNNFLTPSVMWAWKVLQANKRFLKENIPKTCLKFSKQALRSSSLLRIISSWFGRYIFCSSGINCRIPNNVTKWQFCPLQLYNLVKNLFS